MDEPQEHYAKWKDYTKDYLLYNSIYMKFLEKAKLYRHKAEWWLTELGVEQGLAPNGLRVTFWGNGSVLKLACDQFSAF